MLKQCPEQCSDDAPRNPRNETYVRTYENQDLGDNSPVLNVREISGSGISSVAPIGKAIADAADAMSAENTLTMIRMADDS